MQLADPWNYSAHGRRMLRTRRWDPGHGRCVEEVPWTDIALDRATWKDLEASFLQRVLRRKAAHVPQDVHARESRILIATESNRSRSSKARFHPGSVKTTATHEDRTARGANTETRKRRSSAPRCRWRTLGTTTPSATANSSLARTRRALSLWPSWSSRPSRSRRPRHVQAPRRFFRGPRASAQGPLFPRAAAAARTVAIRSTGLALVKGGACACQGRRA